MSYSKLVYKKKRGKPFSKENNSDRHDPTTEIVNKFIEEKGFKDKWQKYWDLRKLVISHLKQMQDEVINHTDGLYLPHNLGKIQVMVYDTGRVINWKETLKLRDKRGNIKAKPEDFIYFDNIHTDGFSPKIFYRKYYNTTKNIKLGYYKNKDLWGFKAARLFSSKLYNLFSDKSTPYYHKLTKEYISNRKKYYEYRNIVLDNPDTEW